MEQRREENGKVRYLLGERVESGGGHEESWRSAMGKGNGREIVRWEFQWGIELESHYGGRELGDRRERGKYKEERKRGNGEGGAQKVRDGGVFNFIRKVGQQGRPLLAS